MNSALSRAVPAFSPRPLTSRRINTCGSASKQTTSSPFTINTYAKTPGGCLAFEFSGPSLWPAVAPPTQDALSPRFFITLFEITPIISTLSKKHPGWGWVEDSHAETRESATKRLGWRRPGSPANPFRASLPPSRHSPAAPRAALNDLCSLACPECISRRVPLATRHSSLATSSHPRYPSPAAPLGAS